MLRCKECGHPFGTITNRQGKRIAFERDCGDQRHLLCHKRSVHYWNPGQTCEFCSKKETN